MLWEELSEEVVVGYDARELWMESNSNWDDARRRNFLMVENVAKPLSIDDDVWFDVAFLTKTEEIYGFHWDTWGNLDDVRQLVLEKAAPSQTYAIIAMTQLFTPEDAARFAQRPIHPNTLSDDWEFLGYDIGAGSMLSGIMNMGFRDDKDKANRTALFAHQLNQHHLFADKESALAFAEWFDNDEPLHGPYEVFGLYLVEKITVPG